jgi:hypothetical protein
METVDVTMHYADLVAGYLSDQADWRARRAAAQPHDVRNRRSANALQAAADYVTDLEGQGLQSTFADVVALDAGAWDERSSGVPWSTTATEAHRGRVLPVDDEAQRIVRQFCFDDSETTPGPREFEWLLHQIVLGLLRAEASRDEPDPSRPSTGRDLSEMLGGWGSPVEWQSEYDLD